MDKRARRFVITVATLGLAAILAPTPAAAIPVFIDIAYTAVPGEGDSQIDVTAFFDDAGLTGIGTESVTLSRLEATITSARIGVTAQLFELPNTDLLCRTWPGVACFPSVPYSANFRDGLFRGLSGVQGLHGTPIRVTNYPTNLSILFQLGFNPANSFGPLAHVRYARNEPVHDSLQVSHSPITRVPSSGPSVPEPATGALLVAGLIAARVARDRERTATPPRPQSRPAVAA